MKNDKLLDEENDIVPNTPVVKADTRRDHKDENEFLFGDDEFVDDETDDTEVTGEED